MRAAVLKVWISCGRYHLSVTTPSICANLRIINLFRENKLMFIPRVIVALFTIFYLAISSALAAESYDIDLKELRPAPVAKPASKQQNLEIDIKELKAVKAKKSKPKSVKPKTEPKVVPESVPEPVPQKVDSVSEPIKLIDVLIPEVSVTYAEACGMTRQVAEKLGILISHPTQDLGGQTFTARYESLSVTVVCDPTPAELITYGRLLSMRGEQLLVLARTDSSRIAIEKLTEKLGLSFKNIGSAERDSLPQEYLFVKKGQPVREIRLIVYPAVP